MPAQVDPAVGSVLEQRADAGTVRDQCDAAQRAVLDLGQQLCEACELEHRRLDRYGERREEMRRVFDTEGDWGKLLEMFAGAAAA